MSVNYLNYALESDMKSYDFKSPDIKFESRIFSKYPLIGSAILSDKNRDALNNVAKKYINTVLNDPNGKLNRRAKMQITIAIINFAKDWDSEKNSKFWEYICLQFGYRDSNGPVTKILQNALEESMKSNGRLFIEDSTEKGFKATTLVHALSTKRTWYALLDFLFDFYKTNLNWKYMRNDPIIYQMVQVLQKKLNHEADEDSNIEISSKVYLFQQGVKKLILLRPNYACKLFEEMLCKIDSLINFKSKHDVTTYQQKLCQDWFKNKTLIISNNKKSANTDIERDIALDYSKIRIKYVLKNENQINLLLPDIRVENSEMKSAKIKIYYDCSKIYTQNLSWYGNELGKTLNSTLIELPECKTSDIRVEITCDEQIIYDSKQDLNRQIFVFSGEREVLSSQIKKSDYIFVVNEECDFYTENVDVTPINEFKNNGLKAFFCELHDGYVISSGAKLMFFDSQNNLDIKIIQPKESQKLPIVAIDGDNYYFAKYESVCNIILGNSQMLSRIRIIRNGKILDKSQLIITQHDNVYCVGLTEYPYFYDSQYATIQVINLETEKVIFDKRFILVSNIDCVFDKEFYLSEDDYKNACYTVNIDDFSETVYFDSETDVINIPFKNGTLNADIPKVHIQSNSDISFGDNLNLWIGDIPQNDCIKVDAPENIDISFYIDNIKQQNNDFGVMQYGNTLHSMQTDKTNIDVNLVLTTENTRVNYKLVCIYFKERFLQDVKFWNVDNKLYWNNGGLFIGNPDRKFNLKLTDENGQDYSFTLEQTTEYLVLEDSMPIGKYDFEISITIGSLFKRINEVISNGICTIGDENLLRFRNSRIIIDSVIDDITQKYVNIKTCYVDKIQFVGMQDTTEGYCPVYQGVMYQQNEKGHRYEFSFEQKINKNNKPILAVNPIRIVYINDSTLSITDIDNDGLYYYRYYDALHNEKVYAITDHEPLKYNKKNYLIADLYSYRREDLKDV